MRKLIKAFILVLTLVTSFLSAQNTSCDKQARVAKEFIEAYNRQDYSGMKKPFFTLAKVLPLKKGLKNEFEPLYSKYGKAMTHTFEFQSKNKLIIEIHYEKELREKDLLVFHFNKRNRLVGLNFKTPDFIYSKVSPDYINQNARLEIDGLMRQKNADGFNGCALVIDYGREIYKNCFGYSNFTTSEVLNENSRFELASCSKQFTGMAIIILAEQGKLNYNDTLQKFIPDFPYRNITVQNLLTHTSGLPDYMDLLEKHWDKNKFATNYDVVNLLKQYKPKPYFSPDEDFGYSNTGYALLSVVIEKASGTSYPDFLDKYIFKKSVMKNARVSNTRRSKNESIADYAYGYVHSTKENKYLVPDSLPNFKYVIYMDAITGDGTVNASISDLALWEKMLRNHKLVEKTTLEKAYSPYKLKSGKLVNYNFGQFVCASDTNERLVYHGGSWPGYSTFTLHFIDRQTSIIFLSNNEYNRVSNLADQIASILLNQHADQNAEKKQ